MNFIILCLICMLNGEFCRKLLKEMEDRRWISLYLRIALTFFLVLYFLFGLILQNHLLIAASFYILPSGILLGFIFYQQKRNQRTLLENLYSLLPTLIAQMKLGLGFMDAWNKSLQSLENKANQEFLTKISESLQFQKTYFHSHPEIKYFLSHLMTARQSTQALKQIKNLQQKIQVKQLFLRKARQVLFQLRLQSGVMAVLYGGLVVWNLIHYGLEYISLILLSFLLFFSGLLWIFKTGKTLKWSL
ncbi:MAG: hypothetical protein OXB86_03910 [Bdellovibrionales bacterium]|nr:hypothetical protein [Bdellovibrionales bacterium]